VDKSKSCAAIYLKSSLKENFVEKRHGYFVSPPKDLICAKYVQP